jgi:hypothetical protein
MTPLQYLGSENTVYRVPATPITDLAGDASLCRARGQALPALSLVVVQRKT